MALAYQNLVAWQRADDLFVDVHRLTLQQFPPQERSELGSQLRRSAHSVAANIVEGTVRGTAPLTGLIRSARATLNAGCGS